MNSLRDQARFNYLSALIKKVDITPYANVADHYGDRIERALASWDSAPLDRLWAPGVVRQRPARHLRVVGKKVRRAA